MTRILEKIGRIIYVAAFAAAAAPAFAQEPAGVVELFTSQGCSSCPPADAALERLAARDDIIALGYHVDYWDYLGWSDTLGSKANSQRQYAYAKTLERRGVYTPQAIINGRTHTNGAHFDEIVGTVDAFASAGKGLSVDLEIHAMDDRVRVKVAAGQSDHGKANMLVAYFKRQAQIPIERGENAGRTITYVNAVVALQTVGMWDGDALTVDIPETEMAAHEADGCAVLLQTMTKDGHPAEIIGATMLP